jgi:hypothetical protein
MLTHLDRCLWKIFIDTVRIVRPLHVQARLDRQVVLHDMVELGHPVGVPENKDTLGEHANNASECGKTGMGEWPPKHSGQ